MVRHKNIVTAYAKADISDIEHGRQWYWQAHQAAIQLHPDPDVACGVVAVLSPNLPWTRNIDVAQRVIAGERVGLSAYPVNVVKAVRILDGEPVLNVLAGDKVCAFYRCIRHPECSDTVVVDGHARCIADGVRLPVKSRSMTPRQYAQYAAAYFQAASVIGEIPSVVQAVTWVYWRRIHGLS